MEDDNPVGRGVPVRHLLELGPQVPGHQLRVKLGRGEPGLYRGELRADDRLLFYRRQEEKEPHEAQGTDKAQERYPAQPAPVAEAPGFPQLLAPLPAAQRRFGRGLRFGPRWMYRPPCSLRRTPAWARRGYLSMDLIKVTNTFFLHKRTLSLYLTVTGDGQLRQKAACICASRC